MQFLADTVDGITASVTAEQEKKKSHFCSQLNYQNLLRMMLIAQARKDDDAYIHCDLLLYLGSI